MRIDRLEQLVRVLEEVERTGRELDMHTWVSRDPDDPSGCRTAACALGWVALSPDVPEVTVRGEMPSFALSAGMWAGMKWLECSGRETLWLFEPMKYRGIITVHDVIRRAMDLMLPPEDRSREWKDYIGSES